MSKSNAQQVATQIQQALAQGGAQQVLAALGQASSFIHQPGPVPGSFTVTQKGTTMASTKAKAIDADIEHFYFRIDLAINPPLPDSKAKAAKNDFFALKQKKDEDVQLINGEIVVVSNNVTSIEQSNDPTDYVYNYADFKKALTGVVALASGAGSSIDGQVVVRDANTQRFFRLLVQGGSVTVEGANLGWPDGTQTPFPDGAGA